MDSQQVAAYVGSILQLVKDAEREAMRRIPDGDPKPDERSVKADVQQVFYDLENALRNQLHALGCTTCF